MRKIKKKIISIILIAEILTISIISSFIMPVGVLALSAGGLQTTIASIIISLMLECGVAPTNNAWLQTLNTSYGVESSIGTIQDCINSGLLTQSGSSLIDTGLSAAIESQSAYTELGLSQIFTTSADDVTYGVVAASGGVNLATTAINVGTAGTIGAFAGAVAVGVGLGVLINHLREKFFSNIGSGIPIDYTTYINGIPAYTPWIQFTNDDGVKILQTLETTNKDKIIFGRTEGTGSVYFINSGFTSYVPYTTYNYNVATGIRYRAGSGSLSLNNTRSSKLKERYIDSNYPLFESSSDFDTYKTACQTGDREALNPFFSPDLVGDNGNQRLDGEEIPSDIKNIVPDGRDMRPVTSDEYNNFVENANDNTDTGNTGVEQGALFEDLVDSLLTDPAVIPDQGVDTPDVPDRPIIPDQPDTPDKEPITPDQQSEVLEGITTPDLRSVFPFCIPFDLYALLGELKDINREAPVIVWEMPEELGGYSIILDFSMFDEAARLLRLLELALFIVGLAIETRNLIGAKG